jgi:hypothetical protein
MGQEFAAGQHERAVAVLRSAKVFIAEVALAWVLEGIAERVRFQCESSSTM